jgi:hypothetical protein
VLATGATDLPQVADDNPTDASDSSGGAVTLESPDHEGIIEFSNNSENESVATIEFTDNSDLSDVSVDVHNVDDYSATSENGTINVTIAADDLQDDFVTFSVSGEEDNSTVESGTYIVYIDETAQEDGIPQGLMTGEEYDPSSYDGEFRGAYEASEEKVNTMIIDQTFTLDEAYGEDGDERTYVLFSDNHPTTYTSDNLEDRLEFQDKADDNLGSGDGGGGGTGEDDGISSWLAGLGGFALAIVLMMGLGFLLLVIYLLGNLTSVT